MDKHDFISIDDLSWDSLDRMLLHAAELKGNPGPSANLLGGRQVALVFERPSTRTRVSAEVAVSSMGGHPVVLRGSEMQLDRGESIEDTGRTLSRYVSAIIVRTSEHSRVERLAESASVPVINALSDSEHPCQALSDLFTIRERVGELRGVHLAFVGDGNNVAHSLMLAGCLAGMNVVVASPRGYEPSATYVDRCNEIVATSGGSVTVTNDPAEAVDRARVVYTDVWASMGRDDEAEERAVRFSSYQVDQDLLKDAAEDAIVMHCLPAHRGREITSDVLDGPRSVVWDQAENRLHVQKAILAWALTLNRL